VQVFTFGDSWGAGSGLKKNESNFTDYLGDALECTTYNYSESGSSLGQITYDFICQQTQFSSDDLVVVIIPPDTRWYTQRDKFIKSMHNSYSSKEYKEFVKGKTDYWFIYHHSLFMHTIHATCMAKNVKVILAHNYGNLIILPEFKDLIPNSVFLDREKSLTALLGSADWEDNYTLTRSGPPDPFDGPYFIEGDTHPNELGHKKIADWLLEKYKTINM